MALKAGCCVLGFPSGPGIVLRIMRNGRQRFGRIDCANVLVGVVFNAFPNPSRCHSLAYCDFAYHKV
ncbi:hypothetical protein T4B_8984 [Trichinella pseudospiralis]|uniref:Uncharacterized protein n=1 Tax=Trichinella pseudospiralis TaxID=6337 RepID=A0A0V1GAU1_TRIPS|nr:hypothetical protein T4B_8984 [Trichinella pseudospiralis]